MTSERFDTAATAERLFLEAEQDEERGDVRNAFKRLLAAAELGHDGARINLGNFYALGAGVRKNLARAAYWYKKAYKNGYRLGALNLAIDRKKQGNVGSAIMWLKKAIAMNDGEACVELAKIYRGRRDGRKDAIDLLKRALRMSRYDISQAGKEEAESLLRDLDTGEVKTFTKTHNPKTRKEK